MKRVAIEGSILAAALVLGLVLWTAVAFSYDDWSDRFWAEHGHPPARADAVPEPYVQPLLMFGPAVTLAFVRGPLMLRRRRVAPRPLGS